MSTHRLPARTEVMVLRDHTGMLTGDELAEWATAALADGHDSPAIRELAGLDLDGCANLYDAERLFARALVELGVDRPDVAKCASARVRELARAVLDGTVSAKEALDRVHGEVISPLDHPGEFAAWCYIWEGNEPDLSGPLKGDLAGAVRRLAASTLAEPA